MLQMFLVARVLSENDEDDMDHQCAGMTFSVYIYIYCI